MPGLKTICLKCWRLVKKSVLFSGIIVGSLADSVFRAGLPSKHPAYRKRAEWLAKWSRRTLKVLDITVQAEGQPPTAGLLASNHMGYLDILVLATNALIVNVAKAEVKQWPIFGWLVGAAGTLFLRRERRSDVKLMASQFLPVLSDGCVISFFPEATSSNGRQILPFHSGLFAVLENTSWPATGAWIQYQMDEGSVEDDVCYWGDMTFFPHFLKLMTRTNIRAKIIYTAPVKGLGRKETASQLHDRIIALAAQRGVILEQGRRPSQ